MQKSFHGWCRYILSNSHFTLFIYSMLLCNPFPSTNRTFPAYAPHQYSRIWKSAFRIISWTIKITIQLMNPSEITVTHVDPRHILLFCAFLLLSPSLLKVSSNSLSSEAIRALDAARVSGPPAEEVSLFAMKSSRHCLNSSVFSLFGLWFGFCPLDLFLHC